MPPAAVTVVVPASVAPLVPVPTVRATVTFPANVVLVFPRPPTAATPTGLSTLPASTSPGCPVNTSCTAAPALTSKPVLTTPATPLADAVSVYAVPVLSTRKFENVAIPATAATVVVPLSVPLELPVPGVSASVTLGLADPTVLPSASCTATGTAGLIVAPAMVALGWTVRTSFAGGPALTLNVVLVITGSPDVDALST